MDISETLQAELAGLRHLTLEDADLREMRERRVLLRQSIADEEGRIADIDRRKDWALRFDNVNALLMRHHQEAQNASRTWASAGTERSNLELYDRLIAVRPLYDKIKTMNEALTHLHSLYNENEQAVLEARGKRDAARAAADVARQRLVDCREALQARISDFNVGYHIEGVITALERQLKQSESLLKQFQLALVDKERKLKDIRQQEGDLIKQTEEANTQLKGLSAHSVMLGLYDLVKDKLSAMGKERQLNEKLHAQQVEAGRQREMMQLSLRQHEGELTMLQREYDQCRSQLLILNQSADTVLDVVRAPIIRDEDETRHQLDRFLDLRMKVRRLEEQQQIVETQCAAKREQLGKMRTEAAVADSHRLTLEQSMRESDAEVGVLYADLDKIITLSGWFTEWQRNPDALRSRIAGLYHEWQNARTRYSECSRSVALLRESLAAAEQSVAEARQQEIQQRNLRDGLRRELENQRERLRAVFGEQSPAELEKTLSTDYHQANDKYEEARKEEDASQEAYRQCQSRLQMVKELQEKLQNALREEGSSLDLWLQNNNVSGKPVLQRPVMEEIFASKCDWPRLRQQLEEASINQKACGVRLEDTQRVMAELQRSGGMDHPSPDDTPANLLQRRHEAEQRLERFRNELKEVEGRLFAHELACRKIEKAQA